MRVNQGAIIIEIYHIYFFKQKKIFRYYADDCLRHAEQLFNEMAWPPSNRAKYHESIAAADKDKNIIIIYKEHVIKVSGKLHRQ